MHPGQPGGSCQRTSIPFRLHLFLFSSRVTGSFLHFDFAHFLLSLFVCLFFWLCYVACGILVPQPGIEPTSPALKVWSLNH